MTGKSLRRDLIGIGQNPIENVFKIPVGLV
jgi:hypothetical protein